MKRVVVYSGVFLVATVFLFGLYSVSIKYSEIAQRPGVKACLTTGCYE